MCISTFSVIRSEGMAEPKGHSCWHFGENYNRHVCCCRVDLFLIHVQTMENKEYLLHIHWVYQLFQKW